MKLIARLTLKEWGQVLTVAQAARTQWENGTAHLVYQDAGPVPDTCGGHVREQISSQVMIFGLTRPVRPATEELLEVPVDVSRAFDELIGESESSVRT